MTTKTFKTHCYVIRALTNLHMGSGDTEYGVIDKLVQRDSTTGYPVLHASGIKGAMREYFEDSVDSPDGFVQYVFGGTKDDDPKKGEYKFLDGHLISLPVRSNERPFYRTTSYLLLGDFLEKNKSLDTGFVHATAIPHLQEVKKKAVIFKGSGDTVLEDFDTTVFREGDDHPVWASLKNLEPLLGNSKSVALCSDASVFKHFSESLPVIARNKLENGISENLWYEQIVPREARFYCFFSVPYKTQKDLGAECDQSEYLKHFENHVNGKIIQLGANASIGYGLCEFTKIAGV